jgi:PAS domain S-box-containing protein
MNGFFALFHCPAAVYLGVMHGVNPNGTILVVDDEVVFRSLLSTCLRLAGYQVIEAATGREGLQKVRESRPDLVLLDVKLPDFGGMEVCRQIKSDADLRDVLVILCSGNAISSADKVDGLGTGADDYLTKPVNQSELLARIQTMMRLRNTIIALRASEEHHRRLIDILPDAVVLVQRNGQIQSVNSRAVAMLGYDCPSDLTGKNIFELMPAKDHERIKADIVAAFKIEVVHAAGYTMLRKNGVALQVELNATVSGHGNGQPASLVCVLRDVTERKRGEDKIQHLLNLLDQAHDVIIVRDLEGRIQYFNKGAEVVLGWRAEEVKGRRVNELFFQNSPTFAVAQDQLLRTGGWSGMLLGFDRNQRPMVFQSRWTLVRENLENVPLVVCIFTDITEQKLAEEQLKEHELLSKRILGATSEGFCRLDLQGKLLEVNEAYCRFTGYSREQLLCMSIGDLDVNLPSPEALRRHIKHILKAKDLRFETGYRCNDGRTVDVEIFATSLKLREFYIFEFVRDQTERKRTEEELRSFNRRIIEVQEAERLRIAGELHDGINQIIASVKMRLKKVGDNLPQLKPAAREILSRCDQLLIKALEENRRIAHNLRPSDLDHFGLFAACQNYCDEMQLRSNLRLQCHIGSFNQRLAPEMELNLFRIIQEAIANIERHAQAGKIKVQLAFQDNSILLKIADDGIGFDLKKTGARRQKGRGFGLTNMRERAVLLGGNL